MKSLARHGRLFVNLVYMLTGEHKNMEDVCHEEFFVLLMCVCVYIYISL